jgi:hypothetical protein
MDDWITNVYGRTRTRRIWDVLVIHDTAHGRRYEVDETHHEALKGLIQKGRERILAYMRKHQFPPDVITRFESDVFEFNVSDG